MNGQVDLRNVDVLLQMQKSHLDFVEILLDGGRELVSIPLASASLLDVGLEEGGRDLSDQSDHRLVRVTFVQTANKSFPLSEGSFNSFLT